MSSQPLSPWMRLLLFAEYHVDGGMIRMLPHTVLQGLQQLGIVRVMVALPAPFVSRPAGHQDGRLILYEVLLV